MKKIDRRPDDQQKGHKNRRVRSPHSTMLRASMTEAYTMSYIVLRIKEKMGLNPLPRDQTYAKLLPFLNLLHTEIPPKLHRTLWHCRIINQSKDYVIPAIFLEHTGLKWEEKNQDGSPHRVWLLYDLLFISLYYFPFLSTPVAVNKNFENSVRLGLQDVLAITGKKVSFCNVFVCLQGLKRGQKKRFRKANFFRIKSNTSIKTSKMIQRMMKAV